MAVAISFLGGWPTMITAATVAVALDAIETKCAQHGKTVALTGLNDASGLFHGRLTGRLGGEG